MIVFTELCMPLASATNVFSQLFTKNEMISVSDQMTALLALAAIVVLGGAGAFVFFRSKSNTPKPRTDTDLDMDDEDEDEDEEEDDDFKGEEVYDGDE